VPVFGYNDERSSSEAGDTLVEVLIALVVIGITVASILAAFATTIAASGEQRSLVGADAFLRSFVETASYDISLSSNPPPAFVPCPSGVPSAYSAIASSFSKDPDNDGDDDSQGSTNDPDPDPSPYTVTITSVSNEGSGPCNTSQALPQQITALVSASGVSDSTVFVVSQPNSVAPAISTAVTSISPNFGRAEGGTSVLISGSGFKNEGVATAVNFGTTAATSFTVNSDTSITATAPAGTGSVDVTVTTPAGTSPTNPLDLFTYAPTVTGIGPSSGPSTGGTSVTITGTGFTGATGVSFGSTAATSYTVASSTSLTAVSPALSPGTVHITVTTFAGTSTTSSADRFTYRISVTGVSPSSGVPSGGYTVDLLGAGFTGATAVTFGTTAATNFTVNSDVSITATVPPGTTGTVVDITVTGPSGTSATSPADQFTYAANPPVGLGLVIKSGGGSGNPVVACGTGTGSTCSRPNNQMCIMTGSSNSTTCAISGIWSPGNSKKNPASVVFYIETVDANGNPVVYSTTTVLNLSVNSATPNPITIPVGGTSTFPNGVTATLTNMNNTTMVTITGAGYTLNITVSS
jgi:type II secretory pathway pseudopilin PulG